MRPPVFLFGTCPKRKTAPRAGVRKKRALGRMGSIRTDRGSPPSECWHTRCARVSAAATVYKSQPSEAPHGGSTLGSHACKGRRPRRPEKHTRRAAAWSGLPHSSGVPGSGSGIRSYLPREPALAATPDLPLDSSIRQRSPEELRAAAAGGRGRRHAISAAAPLAGRCETGPPMALAARWATSSGHLSLKARKPFFPRKERKVS